MKCGFVASHGVKLNNGEIVQVRPPFCRRQGCYGDPKHDRLCKSFVHSEVLLDKRKEAEKSGIRHDCHGDRR